MSKKQNRPGVSVLIPSYMGQALLFKHLAKVMAIMRPGDQLIIVDDASPDQGASKNYLIKKFKLKIENQNRWPAIIYKGQWQGMEIILAINQKNLRFGETVNLGFKLAKQRLVFLINNDVAPNSNVLEYLIPHFSDKKMFAVTCLEKNGKQKKDWAGKNQLRFEQGIFKHNKAADFKTGPTAWASGGSSLIDRDKFLQLGGFDKRFKPAYWEDIDLSFQARKKGWQVLFESQAVVEHHHETTNQGVFGQEKIKRMSWKNAKKFTKKNADFWQKIAYFLWRPYWLIQEMKLFGHWPVFKNCLILIAILLLASLLRFYQLGRVPQGMAVDEVAIGYNGFAIWQARRDEWLEFLPISFRSYGDYKAPLAIYLNAVSTALFGLNLWAVRLPFTVFSILAVLGIYLLAKELLKQAKINEQLALWATLFLALSPWHLHYSRLGFEAGIALSLLIWGVYFFYRYLHQQKLWQIILAAFLASMTLYTYHSAKVTTPLLFLIIWLTQRRQAKVKWPQLLITFLLTNFILSPLLYNAVYEDGFTRAGSSALFANIAWSEKLNILFNNTLSFFSWDFLAKGQVLGQLRHGDGHFGVLSYPALVLIIAYALSLFIKKVPFKKSSSRILNLALIWIVIGYLPAIIGDQPFHSNRALLALPGWILLEVLAFERLSYFFKKHSWGLKAPVLVAYTLFLIVYQRHYYQSFAKESASAFNDGYLATFEYLKKLDKSGVDKILFSNDYQHAYIYTLFANKVNPIAYHGGILAGYEFSDNVDFQDLNRKKTIVVATLENDMLHYEPDHIIYGSDGSERFRIYLAKD